MNHQALRTIDNKVNFRFHNDKHNEIYFQDQAFDFLKHNK